MTLTPEPSPTAGGQPSTSPAAPGEPTHDTPPAAWYADPTRPGTLRYWDGAAWTSHTAPAPPASTDQPTFATFDAADVAGTGSPRSRRRGRLVAIGGGIAGLIVVLGARLLSIGGIDAVTAFFNTIDAQPLTAQPEADWVTLDILEGHGTVQYDPSWVDADLDLSQLSEAASTGIGPDVSVDAAWVIDTDANGNQSILYVYSARGLTGVVQPELEVDAMIESAFPEKTDTEKVSGAAIVTAMDARGYMAEFEYDYYGWHFIDSAASIVYGPDEVMLYVSSAGEDSGSGIDQLEAVLNSLSIGD